MRVRPRRELAEVGKWPAAVASAGLLSRVVERFRA